MIKTVVVALAALSFAGSASATTNDNPFARDSTVLRLADLDLSSADGQERLEMRMNKAARTVCGERLASVSLVVSSQAAECVAIVKADIRGQIESRMALSDIPSQILLAHR